MNDVRVVVVIVTYKSADLTIDCLRSIEAELDTPGVDIRVVVVDNASGDAPVITKAVEANGWSSFVKVVAAPKNGGFAYGNNVGVQAMWNEGPPDYFHLLNPDTVVRKGAIGALVRFLEEHPEAGIAGGRFENLDGSDWHIAFRFPTLISELEEGLQLGLVSRLLSPWVVARHMKSGPQQVDWVSGASFMVRRAVYETIGAFDENYFLYYEEIDFCYRAKKAGFTTWYVPESNVMHIAGQSTGATERNVAPKRLPDYWFESRRRYFAATHGVWYAMATDIVALLAHGVGAAKRALQGRAGVPHFMSDLVRHSALRRKNRHVAALRHLALQPEGC